MRWLLDEVLPPSCAVELRSLGHDASTVLELGMAGAEDADVFARAIKEARLVVTENFSDYTTLVSDALNGRQPCAPVVFVRRENLPRRGALGVHLARHLHAWAGANPDPYLGLHWP